MKQVSKLLAAAGFAAALISTQASAALIFAGEYGPGTNSYIGLYNSANNDSANFSNSNSAGALNPIPVSGTFTNTWVFNFTPGGSATINANFIPGFPDTNAINPFNVALYQVTSGNVCGGNTLALAGTCAGALTLSFIANGNNFNHPSNIGFTPLITGLYAFQVTGNVVGGAGTSYSGNVGTRNVPEPGSQALAGIALFGLAATLRKSKAKA